ncbi:MAG: NAD-dependent epimerase/dehydratase family protein [Candidatus Levybacteria bacterium]|nr:NAD-dependent epimerase/dehydratase family protein [Candidatus Levybacteria bacterium]
MRKDKILVTGAAGFMGSHLVDALINNGYENVFGIDDFSGGYKENINVKSKFEELNLVDKEKTEKYIKKIKPDIIFHLAADATEGRSQFTPLSCTERNYLAYLNVLVPSIRNGLKKVILTSSMSIYGAQKPPFAEDMPYSPEDIYGVSKAAMERATKILSQVHDFKYVIFRPHNVYGPKQNLSDPYRNVIAIFINCLLNCKKFYIYGDGQQKRAFTYIDDFTPYILKSAFLKEAEGEIFNIGPTEEISINELTKTVFKYFFPNSKVPLKFKPKYLPLRPLEVKEAWCTVDKAQKILGYRTTVSLDEGIKKMIKWAKEKGPQKFHYLKKLEIINKNAPASWVNKLI